MIRTLIGFMLCVGVASAQGSHISTAAERPVDFIVQGVPRDVRTDGAAWTEVEGALIGRGTGNVLYGGQRLGAGDFSVRARLAIEGLAGSAASLVVGGSHFGFAGRGGEMFTEGALFGRRDLGAPVVQDGKVFDLMARRRGDQLSVSIDGAVVLTVDVDPAVELPVGLRPWRSTMRVEQFGAQGALIEVPRRLPHQNVFVRGTGAYHTYRIPAAVVTNEGTVLAFAEGRATGGGDAGDIDLLLRRSEDSGATWSDLIVLWDDGAHTCGNPSPVVDRDTGHIWMAMTWNRGSDHERDIMDGTSDDVRHVFVTHSEDDGRSWSAPRKISETTRRDHWRWYATGPGNGIQLTRGAHRGRLLIPANHSDHSDPDAHPYRSHVIWSDDHGATWQLGGVHEERTNESAVVELAGGAVLQSMRSYHGKGNRAMAVSADGGASWGELYLDDALQTPVCQASILRFSWPGEGVSSQILFASPRGGGRSNLTVWLSEDEGKTWPVRRQIYDGGAAYSNLVALPDGRIGLLYEKDGYQSISLAAFELDWLRGDR